MSEDRKTAGAGFWITITLIAVLVAVIVYPLSLLPFLWLANHGWLPEWIIAMPIYAPLQSLRIKGPQPIREALDWYINICLEWR